MGFSDVKDQRNLDPGVLPSSNSASYLSMLGVEGSYLALNAGRRIASELFARSSRTMKEREREVEKEAKDMEAV